MYIGENKIKGTIVIENTDEITVMFKGDKPEVKISKKLFDVVSTKEKGKGSTIDAIRHFLSTKFLMELSEYGLEFYMIDQITGWDENTRS